jgi:hypothetical protein
VDAHLRVHQAVVPLVGFGDLDLEVVPVILLILLV